MNKHLHRIVFSASRGQLVAVQETAASAGKATGSTRKRSVPRWARAGVGAGATPAWALKAPAAAFMAAALCSLVFTAPAWAQIIADPAAPGSQRPTVLSAGNGVPVVNIQTPSAAGISRNTYSQFDVQRNGAILNNSRGNVQTQLGGWVQGNPWLGGPAKVILNEVNSANPSLLRGALEVAGPRADVIVANPAGIKVDGAGFINASSVVLTTGVPVLGGAGNLESYRVQRGSVVIEGLGLDTRSATYTDILARAIEVNAGLWADYLRLSAGAGEVNAANPSSTTVLQGTGAKPAFALDVAAIGGMYANHIYLVGTEAGLGVSNAGVIGATAGNVVLLADGTLTNRGSIQSAANVQVVTGGGIVNSGTVYAGGNAVLATQGSISNAGLIAAQGDASLQATGAGAGVDSGKNSSILAGLNADGTVGTAGVVTVSASGNAGLNGRTTAGMVSVSAAALNTDGGVLSADKLALSVQALSNVGGEIVQTGAADLALNVSGGLNNTAGRIATNSQNLSMTAATLGNAGGKLEHAGVGTLRIQASTLDGAGGQLTSNGTLSLNAGRATLDRASTIAARLDVQAATLSNQGGEILQTGTQAAHIAVTGALNNAAGRIVTNGDAVVTAQSIDNRGGTLQTAGASTLTISAAGLVDNSAAGRIAAGGAATLSAGVLTNAQGQLTAGEALTATAGGAVTNTAGLMAANGRVTLAAASLDNTRGTVASVNDALAVTTGGAVTNDSGKLQAALDVAVTSRGLGTAGGSITGRNLDLRTGGQNVNNARGTIAATGTLALAGGALDNTAGLIQSGGAMTLDTHGQALTNTQAAGHASGAGGIASQGTLDIRSASLDNAAGYIGARGSMSLDTGIGGVGNTAGGQIVGEASVRFTGNGFDNRGGQVQALGDITLDAGAGTIHNTVSLIRGAGATRLSATRVDNANTSGTNQGIEGKDVAVTAATIGNAGGAIRADHDATLTSDGRVDNTAGLISAGNSLTVKGGASVRTLAVTNTSGTLIAGQAGNLTAASLTGDGKVLSKGTLAIDLASDFSNTGEVTGNGDVTISTTGNVSNSGKLQSGATLDLSGNNVENTAGGEITGVTTRITAANTLTNRGLIDGRHTQLNAVTVSNLGTGRIYGDRISIQAGTLNNLAQSGAAPVIAARERLDLGVSVLNNRDHALLFSGGGLYVGGALDANRHATASAQAVNNASASIEAMGELAINAQVLANTNERFSATEQLAATRRVVQHAEAGGQRMDASEVRLCDANGCVLGDNVEWLGKNETKQLLLPSADYPLSRFAAYYASFPKFSLDTPDPVCHTTETADGCGGTIAGQKYANTDPIWAAFGVAPYMEPEPFMAEDNNCPKLFYGCTVGAVGYYPIGDLSGNITFLDRPISQTDVDQWNAHQAWRVPYEAAHAALDARLKQFNASVASRLRTNWNYWDYTETLYTPVLASSDPARITSGGVMTLAISGAATNSMSQIVAGGALNVSGVAVNNASAEGATRSVQVGQVVHTFKKGKCGSSCNGDDRDYEIAPYNLEVPGIAPLTAAILQGSTGTSPISSAPVAVSLTGVSLNAVVPVATEAALRVWPIVQVPASVSAVSAVTSGQTFIRTTTVSWTGGNSSLFRATPNPASSYLIETDPRFADQRSWLSSDFMLASLGYEPTTVLKRLGDGFIEQRLVREQVASLTGLRFLGDYTSDNDQYQALMEAGATYAKAWNLRPGIALTDAQMAQLTSDIVWLVEQTIALPDGSTARALVPQVYARVREGDLATGGALLAGNSVNAKLSGDLTNSGLILGRSVVSLTAENVQNLAGRIQGDAVGVTARNDLNVIGGQINAASSLAAMAGRDLNVQSTTRSGEAASGGTAMTRTSIDRVAGLYVSGDKGTLVALAGRDVNLVAGLVSNAGKDGATVIQAGRDLNLGTLTTSATDSVTWSANHRRAETASAEIGSQIQAVGSVTLLAGNDINARAATVQAGGALTATAGRDINLDAGQDSQSVDEAHRYVSKGFLSKKTTTTQDSASQTVAALSSLSGDSVSLTAGRDIQGQGGQLVAQGALELEAGRHIKLDAAENTSTESHSSQTVKQATGLAKALGTASVLTGAVTAGAAFLTKSDARQAGAQTTTEAVGSTLSGGSIRTRSGGDTTTQGATIVADGDIDMKSGGDMRIGTAESTTRSESQSSNRKSGFIGSISQPAVGTIKQGQEETLTSTRQTGSTVASLAGNITMIAGGTFDQTGSKVLALGQALGTGDVTIRGKNVIVDEAYDTQVNTTHSQMSKTAIGGSISVPVLEAAKALKDVAEAAGNTSDARTQALAAATMAMQAKSVADATAAAAARGAGFKASISLGTSKSESTTSQSSSTVVGSVVSGNDVSIKATGDGLDSNVIIRGSDVKAVDTASISADGKVFLLGAQNTHEQHSTNKSSGASIGIGFAMGTNQNGFTLDMAANRSQGNADGTDLTWTNSHVSGNTVIINSGGDTEIKGAVVTANTVKGKIEGDLKVESLQDKSTYEAQQKTAGAGISVCVPPFCVGASTVSGSAGATNVKSTFESVGEQSGIRAGDGGFQIDVKGGTDLKGGAITSTQKAIDEGKNTFTSAGGITTSDVVNKATYEADGYSVSGGYSTEGKDRTGKTTSLAGPSGSAGIGSDAGSASSVTQAAISGIAGDKDARTGDAEVGLKPIFDAAKVQKEIDAQVKVTAEFGKQAPKAWADYAQSQQKAALKRGDTEEAEKWGEQGAYRVAGHTLIAALSGSSSGAAGALVSATVMPDLGKVIDAADLPPSVKVGLGMVASSTLGAIVGGMAGAASSYNVDTNNRQLHPTEEKWLRDKAKEFANREGITETEAMQRLTQQALKNVDLIWRAQLSDGDDASAKSFLATSGQTFKNELGEPQPLFTAPLLQVLRPEMLADNANPTFYKQFAQSGIARDVNAGLVKELKDAGIDVKNATMDLVKAAKDNPSLAASAVWDAVKGLPQSIVESFKETGLAIGQGAAVALNKELSDKLNSVYGSDVEGLQKAVLAIRITAAVTGAAGTAKAATGAGDATAAAIGKKLDKVLDQKAVEALVRSGGVLDADGLPLLDMRGLSTQQKGRIGELFGEKTVMQIVPDGQKLARMPGVGETGIDDLYKVTRPDVDYVVIEYKFVGSDGKTGASALRNTLDGKQGAASWTMGSGRLEKALDDRGAASDVADSIKANRVETWVVTTRPDGTTEVQILDSLGKAKPVSTSTILDLNKSLSGAKP